MPLNTTAFQEPRGVMRVLQFIFAICAFATVCDFNNSIDLTYNCGKNVSTNAHIDFEYPFRLDRIDVTIDCNSTEFPLFGDFSSDAQFFVATGVLSFLYCIGIAVVYALFEDVYQANFLFPMVDFSITVILAVLWLSGSAAWSNGIAGLKSVTNPDLLFKLDACRRIVCTNVAVGNFSSLTVSAILGFLNFFLWASDLWFLYKETQWFKNANPPPTTQSPTGP